MMLYLLETSAAAAMWNETVFPSVSPSGHSFGNGEAWLQSSNNASMELERLVNRGKFLNGLLDNYGEFSFDRHVFSPTLESNSDIFPGNCYGDEAKDTAGSLDVMGEGRKLVKIRDPTNKHEGTFSTTPHQSKRLKTSYSKQHQSTIIPGTMSLSKVPVRRTQKLGDKITALQQLVSPFGKTDTASVLHEAALSIKFLHGQIEMLTTPYTGIGSPPSHHQGLAQSSSSTGDLRKRGLCLVPIYTILGLNWMEKEPTDMSL